MQEVGRGGDNYWNFSFDRQRGSGGVRNVRACLYVAVKNTCFDYFLFVSAQFETGYFFFLTVPTAVLIRFDIRYWGSDRPRTTGDHFRLVGVDSAVVVNYHYKVVLIGWS